jgi:cell division protein FtsB
VDTAAKDAEIATLGKQNGDLKMENAVLKQEVEDLKTRITDMETKAALAREALGL